MLVLYSSFNNGNSEISTKMMKYIATRPGVALNESSIAATFKQKELIDELITSNSMLKNLPEYKTYLEDKTISKASNFITEATNNLIPDKDNKIYLKYISERPGVERDLFNTHGLFNAEGHADLEKELDKLEKYSNSNVWTHILSLKREDAIACNMNSKDDWEKFLKLNIHEIAKDFDIPINNLEWNAAFHDEKHHPHVHLMIYSRDPAEGKLSKQKTIAALKDVRKDFTNKIFHEQKQEINNRYEKVRQEFRSKLHSTLNGKDAINTIDYTDKQRKDLISLKDNLSNLDGKIVYGYLPSELKKDIGNFLKDLIKTHAPETLEDFKIVQKEYLSLFYDDLDKIEKQLPKFEDRLFYPNKNDSKAMQNELIRYIQESNIEGLKIMYEVDEQQFIESSYADEELAYAEYCNEMNNNAEVYEAAMYDDQGEIHGIDEYLNSIEEIGASFTQQQELYDSEGNLISDEQKISIEDEIDSLELEGSMYDFFDKFYSNFYKEYYHRLYQVFFAEVTKQLESKHFGHIKLDAPNIMRVAKQQVQAEMKNSIDYTKFRKYMSLPSGKSVARYYQSLHAKNIMQEEKRESKKEFYKSLGFKSRSSTPRLLVRLFEQTLKIQDHEMLFRKRETEKVQRQNIRKSRGREHDNQIETS